MILLTALSVVVLRSSHRCFQVLYVFCTVFTAFVSQLYTPIAKLAIATITPGNAAATIIPIVTISAANLIISGCSFIYTKKSFILPVRYSKTPASVLPHPLAFPISVPLNESRNPLNWGATDSITDVKLSPIAVFN